MNPASSLGPRLDALYELVVQIQQKSPYPVIWDCCCDHGYLGIKILAGELCEMLVFVDQVPHIIEQLGTRLAPFSNERHQLIASDAGQLTLDQQQRHLLILAGVGGERSVDIINAIEQKNPSTQIDYIFCPSTSQNALREYLAAKDFALLTEMLVYEKKRYYEILYVQGKAESKGLSAVPLSCNVWDENDPQQQHYLAKLKQHELLKKLSVKDSADGRN